MGRFKFIAFEGCDGTGKTTQAKLLAKRFSSEGRSVRRLKFPVYESLSSGPVRMYLDGQLGGAVGDIDPYAASTLYAVDRFCSFRSDWRADLGGDGIIVSDRYVTSNMIYMSARLKPAERGEYIRWLRDLEYNKMGLPEPDLVIYLDLPTKTSEKLVRLRSDDTGETVDLHERDRVYQKEVRLCGREIAREFGWVVINCAKKGMLLPMDELSDIIWAKVNKHIKAAE